MTTVGDGTSYMTGSADTCIVMMLGRIASVLSGVHGGDNMSRYSKNLFSKTNGRLVEYPQELLILAELDGLPMDVGQHSNWHRVYEWMQRFMPSGDAWPNEFTKQRRAWRNKHGHTAM